MGFPVGRGDLCDGFEVIVVVSDGESVGEADNEGVICVGCLAGDGDAVPDFWFGGWPPFIGVGRHIEFVDVFFCPAVWEASK